MSFSLQDTKDWLIRHKWAVALLAVVVFGYTFGKDMALRQNAIEAAAVGEAE